MARAGAKRSTRKLKIGRSLGVNLWGQAKSPFNKRKYKPGQHGPTSRGSSLLSYQSFYLLLFQMVHLHLITQNRCAQNRH